MTDVLGLMQALAALAVVFALVWFGRRALAGSSLFGRRSERMQVEERLALDLRNALVIVCVEERRLLLSTSDHGPARLVAELSRSSRAAPAPLDTHLSEP
ncbi:MAG: hypothetical protein JWN04_4914 [Myxococcaceae bacterium]|nr:hypothetical protein [Myxococcaceae bacterium]